MVTQRKKRRGLKIFLGFLILFFCGLTALYYLIQSPRFLGFLIHRLNQTIPGEIQYEALKVDLEKRRLNLRGFVYNNKEGKTIVRLNSLDLNFSPVGALKARLDISQLRAEGLRIDQRNIEKILGPSSWRTTVRLILKNISLQDSIIDHINIILRNGDEMHFDKAHVLLSPQVAGEQHVGFEVQQSLLKPGNTSIQSNTLSFQGDIKIPVLADFSFLVSEALGKFKLQEVQVGNLPASSFESDFKISGDTLYLIKGHLQHPEGTLDLDCEYNPQKSTYKIDLKTAQPLPFRIIPKASKELLETFDSFELQVKAELIGFKIDQMDGEVELEAKVHGNHANPQTPTQQLELKGRLNNGNLVLENFKIQSAKTQLKAKGEVDLARKKLNVEVEVKDFDVETLVEALSDIDLHGYGNAQGTIQGDFKSPEFFFKAQAGSTGYSFLNFGAIAGIFKISGGNLSFEGKTSGEMGNGSVTVTTENIFKKNKHTSLKTQFENMDVSRLVDNPDLKGKVSGTFDMEDTSDTSPVGKMSAVIHDFWVTDFHVGETHAEGRLGNQKFILNPVSFQPPNVEKITVPKETVFSFDDRGVTVVGEVLPGAAFTGSYVKSQPNKFNIDATLNHLDIRPLLATLEMNPMEGYADGKVRMAIGLMDTLSEVAINLSRFVLPLEEGQIQNAEPVEINIRGPRINLTRVRFRAGEETFALQGTWLHDAGFDLRLTGKLDLELLKFFPKYFREGSGFADLNLKVTGNKENPQISGDIAFQDSGLTLRAFRGAIENLNGKLSLTNNSANFENLKGTLSEGDVIVNGRVDLKDFKPNYYDLKIETREAALSDPGVYKLVFSGDFALKGGADNARLSGKMFITEGRYSRDFSIAQFILKPAARALPSEPNPFLKDLNLDLEIKSSGELAIKNNVAKMFLQSDLVVQGPATKPKISGAMEILEGEFRYFKIAFENAKGIIDFRDPTHGPYVDVLANKDFTQRFSTVNVTAHIQGFTDNLQLNFSSDAGLEKRDILALVFTGYLPGEGAGFTSTQIATSVLTSQLNAILEGTVAEKAQLDVFRMEASDPERKNITTLVVGKKLTERLSLEFKTDLGVDEPLQGIQMEYLLLDNLLMKASQFTDGSFDFNLTLRWRSF